MIDFFNDFKKYIKMIVIKNSFIILKINDIKIKILCKYFKINSLIRAKQLMDLFVIDYPEEKKRFEINYMLLSLEYNYRIMLKINIKEYELVQSLSEIYDSVIWLEREGWDMYGICFLGNKDLRRILTDYGFLGYPLRKDFPLTGYVEIRYDDIMKGVIIDYVEMSQELRVFDFRTPWNIIEE